MLEMNLGDTEGHVLEKLPKLKGREKENNGIYYFNVSPLAA